MLNNAEISAIDKLPIKVLPNVSGFFMGIDIIDFIKRYTPNPKITTFPSTGIADKNVRFMYNKCFEPLFPLYFFKL